MATVHVHIHQHADETMLSIQQRIAVAVERLAEQGDADLEKRLTAMSKRLEASTTGLDAVVAANPDPDPAA